MDGAAGQCLTRGADGRTAGGGGRRSELIKSCIDLWEG